MSQDIESKLRNWLRDARRIVVVGVGNPLRRDDSVGVYVAGRLNNALHSQRVDVLECETVPENFLGNIERVRPSHVIVVDTAETGLGPGNVILTELGEVQGLTISSHNIPLSVFGEYLRRSIGAKVALIGIQPERVEFGEGLTRRLKEAAEEVTRIFLKVLA